MPLSSRLQRLARHVTRQTLRQLQRVCVCEICLSSLQMGDPCHFLCQSCWQQLPTITNPCCQCGESLPAHHHSSRCQRCQLHPPAFDYCISRFRFSSPIDQWIRRGKDQHQPEWMIRLAQLMYLQAPPALRQAHALVTVPSHWRRLLQRGYNPAAMLAGEIQRQSGVPLLDHTLLRTRSQEQRGASAWQRYRQIRTGLVAGDQPLQGLHILLIEDVVTSGATADWSARLLKQQGAAMVGVWTLARTPAPEYHTAPPPSGIIRP